MNTRLYLFLLAAFIGASFSASAQIDGARFAAEFGAKYGPPLHRQIFIIAAGEMVVDYATNSHICRIQLPPVGPDGRQPGVRSALGIDNLVLELVPADMRGKESRRWTVSTGLHSQSMIEYENVVISEGFKGEQRTGVTITFANEKCQDQSAR